MSGWRAPDVGIVDALGYAWCPACAAKLDKTGDPIAGDQHFGPDDRCDPERGCGAQFVHVRTCDYVKC